MSSRRLIASLLMCVLLLQAGAGAQGSVLCEHADGSERIENFAQHDACHDEQDDRAGSSPAFSRTCTDEPLTGQLLTHQTTGIQNLRVALAALPLTTPPWVVHTVMPPDRLARPRAIDLVPTASEQHALLMSAVALLI